MRQSRSLIIWLRSYVTKRAASSDNVARLYRLDQCEIPRVHRLSFSSMILHIHRTISSQSVAYFTAGWIKSANGLHPLPSSNLVELLSL